MDRAGHSFCSFQKRKCILIPPLFTRIIFPPLLLSILLPFPPFVHSLFSFVSSSTSSPLHPLFVLLLLLTPFFFVLLCSCFSLLFSSLLLWFFGSFFIFYDLFSFLWEFSGIILLLFNFYSHPKFSNSFLFYSHISILWSFIKFFFLLHIFTIPQIQIPADPPPSFFTSVEDGPGWAILMYYRISEVRTNVLTFM